jgi:hypothetical protein
MDAEAWMKEASCDMTRDSLEEEKTKCEDADATVI